jgi:hypothetical protein
MAACVTIFCLKLPYVGRMAEGRVRRSSGRGGRGAGRRAGGANKANEYAGVLRQLWGGLLKQSGTAACHAQRPCWHARPAPNGLLARPAGSARPQAPCPPRRARGDRLPVRVLGALQPLPASLAPQAIRIHVFAAAVAAACAGPLRTRQTLHKSAWRLARVVMPLASWRGRAAGGHGAGARLHLGSPPGTAAMFSFVGKEQVVEFTGNNRKGATFCGLSAAPGTRMDPRDGQSTTAPRTMAARSALLNVCFSSGCKCAHDTSRTSHKLGKHRQTQPWHAN